MILQQQDSVGLVVFDDAVRRYLKPAGQPVAAQGGAPHARRDARSREVGPGRRL